jgi:hypothetical protein
LTKIFLQTISIVWYKILQLKLGKDHLISITGPHVNKYIFQAQYTPETALIFLGLKDVACKLKFLLTMNEMESQRFLSQSNEGGARVR